MESMHRFFGPLQFVRLGVFGFSAFIVFLADCHLLLLATMPFMMPAYSLKNSGRHGIRGGQVGVLESLRLRDHELVHFSKMRVITCLVFWPIDFGEVATARPLLASACEILDEEVLCHIGTRMFSTRRCAIRLSKKK